MPNGRNNFDWSPERWEKINMVVHDQAKEARVARRVLPLFGNSGGYVETVDGHAVTDVPDRVTGGKLLVVKPSQKLTPVVLSVALQLAPEQFNDEQVAAALVTKCAYRMALAEDAVLLMGKNTPATFLNSQGISERNLTEQEGLFANPPTAIQTNDILQSILAGIQKLQLANHHGPYCVIVGLELYMRAYAPRSSTIDAPIYEIRPLLKEGGFLYSSTIDPKAGVIFSLGGNTLDLAVPVDSTVELDDEERGVVRLRVDEQFRLRINDPTATQALA